MLAIFTDIVPLRLRPRYWAAIQVAWAVGTVTGPVIGGACAHPKTWRWIFYINFPICAISLVTVPLLYRPGGFSEIMTSERNLFLSKWRRFDFVGCALFLGSTTSFLVGVTWGGVQYDWDSPQVLVPICLGLAGIVLTIVWERLGGPEWSLHRPTRPKARGDSCSVLSVQSGFTAPYARAFVSGLFTCKLPCACGVLERFKKLCKRTAFRHYRRRGELCWRHK